MIYDLKNVVLRACLVYGRHRLHRVIPVAGEEAFEVDIDGDKDLLRLEVLFTLLGLTH